MKRLPFVIAAIICLYAFLVTFCTKEEEIPTSDPITAVGHGAFVGEGGQEIQVTAKFIETVQSFYLKKLYSSIERKETKNILAKELIDATSKIIHNEVADKILANALLIDWLLEKGQPLQDLAHLTSVNNALRWQYVLKLKPEAVKPNDNVWTKGIKPDVAKRLEAKIGIQILALTNAGGEAYCKECLETGVPVPNFMFGSEWQFVGEVEDEFLSDNLRAELWIYESESPKGVCLALPRFEKGSDKAQLFGVICLGTQTSKACFFDNPRGKLFTKSVRVDFKEFVGGTDLVANAQGVCSDCHAGENPYVVHPAKPAFASILNKIRPIAWHDPLVAASWPQNPGPSNVLDAVSSTGRCDDCHRVGSAGRFPEVSKNLPEYCNVVLKIATGTSAKATMPPGGNRNDYLKHINALKSACGAPPSGSGVVVEVNVKDDSGFISPPIVIDPLYQCATAVAVRGAILDAKVNLFVNGALVGTQSPARNTYQIEFIIPALNAGDKVTANQEFNGAVSSLSPTIIVRDHKVDFPAGLPAPVIDPMLIYECAEVIAVRHVPGATVTIYTNGGNPVSGSWGSTGWSTFSPGKKPFSVGDKFTAEIKLCNDVSPLSIPEAAVKAPSSIPVAKFSPTPPFAGQQVVLLENLTHGTRTKVGVNSVGAIGGFTTPISWYPDFDIKTILGRPIAAGESLWSLQELCNLKSKGETPSTVPCLDLPAPRIQHPIVGNNFVVVAQSVPGARIRVYDGIGKEIGDGSGTVIMLSRAITGADTLVIVQQLGECTSKTGYKVSVRNPNSSSK